MGNVAAEETTLCIICTYKVHTMSPWTMLLSCVAFSCSWYLTEILEGHSTSSSLHVFLNSVHSVTQSCLTLYDHMDYSTPGLRGQESLRDISWASLPACLGMRSGPATQGALAGLGMSLVRVLGPSLNSARYISIKKLRNWGERHPA